MIQQTVEPGTTQNTAPPAEEALTLRRRLGVPGWTGALIALVVLFAYSAITEPAFIKPVNLINILNQNSTVGIVAVGMTLVIILGGIDLSVGALVALAGGVGVLMLNYLYQPPTTADTVSSTELPAVLAAIGVTLGIATLAGLLNGAIIAKGRVAPFIATLAALVAFRSAATWIANGGQFFSEGSTLFADIGEGFAIPGTNISRVKTRVQPMIFPWSVVLWGIVVLVGLILLNRTRLGRYIIAVGSNEKAARYSAIPVDRIKIYTYTLLGLITGLAALMEAAKYRSVNSANAGLLLELDVIAAVVVGGTRMSGGVGSILGTVIGVLLIGVIKNALVMKGVTSYAHGLVMGAIILLAVLTQEFRWSRVVAWFKKN
jgi:ribose transport system permease protein